MRSSQYCKSFRACAWELATFVAHDLELAASLVKKYRDQHIGAADASNVVLADRYQTRTIVTLDRRHFDVLRPLSGRLFTSCSVTPQSRNAPFETRRARI